MKDQVNGRQEFHTQDLSDLVGDVVVRYDDSPARVYGKSNQFNACFEDFLYKRVIKGKVFGTIRQDFQITAYG
jgi:hypothetical protein